MRAIVGSLLVLVLLAASSTAQANHGKAKGYRAVNTAIIHHVFGKYGSQAVAVAKCESGLSVWAQSPGGTYLGLFQFGPYARARYGFAWNAWAQARAAYRYFRDSGRTWGPWSCKPW